jgi:hypothetical protein
VSDQIFSPGSGAKVTYSLVEGGWAGTGNMSADPLFNGSGYTLQSTSPCKNAGLNELPLDIADLDWDGFTTTEQIPKDLADLLRIRQTTVDMGAYEQFGSGGGGGG